MAVCGFAQSFSGGDGSETSPFLISSKEDLGNISNSKGKYYLLTRDLTGKADTVTTMINSFEGIFDGGGHEIAVKISNGISSFTSRYAGLFGYLTGNAIVKNLGISGTIFLDDRSRNDSYYVGGICGSGSPSNCYSQANITITSSASSTYHMELHVGGICGSGNPSNCHNWTNVAITSSASSTSDMNVGGICGSGSPSNCHNWGNVTVSSANSTSDVNVGGICGDSHGLYNCYNAGEIRGGGNTGGICGYSYYGTSVSNCYNIGNVSGNTTGGICGSAEGWDERDNPEEYISNCFNTGNISGEIYTGGICGEQYRRVISNCYNTGDVSGGKCGGICGYQRGKSGSGYKEYTTISCCFAANTKISGNSGRILGEAGIYSIIESCYARSSMLINGATVGSLDQTSKDGKNASFTNFLSQSWLEENLLWDFYDIWVMSDENDPVNKGLPILKTIPIGETGINNLSVDNQLQIYPNPVTDYLSIQSNYPVEKVEIYDQMGKLMVSETGFAGKINVSALPQGLYLVRIYVNNTIITQKLIKK